MNYNVKENVIGENLSSQAAKNELISLLPQLQKYVGQRILINSGTSAKFKIEHTKQPTFRAYLDISSYSIWLKCDIHTTSAPDRNGVCTASYFKKAIYLGAMKQTGELESIQSLEEILKINNLERVIDLETVQNQIKEYKELSEKLCQMKSEFPLNHYFLN